MNEERQIEKLTKLMELMQNDTITPIELEKFLHMTLEFISKMKDEFSTISRENLNKIQELRDEFIRMRPKDGENGKDGYIGRDGVDGKNGEDGEDSFVDYETIINESVKETSKVLTPLIPKLDEVKNEILKEIDMPKTLKELEGRMNERLSSIPRGVANRSYGMMMKFADLSSKTNGSLKVFSVPKNVTGVVFSSDFPTVLMEGNGFTLNGTRTTLTLTTTNAPSSGSQLLFQYASIFNS